MSVASDKAENGGRLAWRRHWAELCLCVVILLCGATILFQHQIFGRDIAAEQGGNLAPFAFDGYSDQVSGGKSTIAYRDPLSWSCTLRAGFAQPYCGYEVVLDGNGAIRGADLSNLDSIAVTIDYDGPPTTLRLQLKNEDPRYSKHGDRSTTKLNKVEFSLVRGRNTVLFHAQDFAVAEWWLNMHKLTPELSRTQMDDVVAIEFMSGSGAPNGDYHFSVKSLRVARSAVAPARLYLAIVGILGGCMILYAFHRYRRVREEALEREQIETQARDALAEAKAAAENASKAKSDFLANMSHELRTPLNAVLGYAQLLQRAPLEEKQSNAVRVIHRSGNHLLALITDILDLSKIEAGKMELNRAPCDLRGAVAAVHEMVRVPADQKGLALSCAIGDDVPEGVEVDEKRLRQVLLNLLGNAVKFTSAGRVSLIVSQIERRDDSALLRFEVQDSGPGIAPDEIQRIFRPFEQVGAQERREGGTGLGLTISRQLVRLMESDIHVQSRVGQGSSFWFDLSIPVVQAETAEPSVDAAAVKGYAGARRRVLVVDDMEDNRGLLCGLLGQIGFDCSEARDGREALQIAQRRRPDIILMDLKMPVMGGEEATRLLRIIEPLKDVPVLILSANVAEESVAEALEAGANGFLTKPIDAGELLRMIGRVAGVEWLTAGDSAAPADSPDGPRAAA